MNKILTSKGATVILLVIGLIIAFAGCGCLSETDGSTDNTIVMDSESYSQSSGTISESGKTYSAGQQDASAIKVTQVGLFSLTDSKIVKIGDASSPQDNDFYGLNAAILAGDGGTIMLSNCTVTTDANGANAVFASGSGSSVTLENVQIDTNQDGSRGVDASVGGTIDCINVDINTQGENCAGIATVHGSGTITFTDGTVETAGPGSPGIYSTGYIAVTNSVLTAAGSEAAVIKGKSSITLNNCTLTGMRNYGVMLYQNNSGDAEVGTSVFTMTGGTLTATEGPLFYSTNTEAVLNLKGAELAGTGVLFDANANEWGTEGSNGAVVTLNASEQVLEGDVTADSVSSITMNLKDRTSFKGVINADNTAATMILNLDSGSTWNVAGNSYLTAITDEDTTLSNIQDNGFTIYYDANDNANQWLAGETHPLKGGGKLTPLTK